jgi:hypothetical protein
MDEYRWYLIEQMHRWFRVSKGDKIVAKLFTTSWKEVRHEIDKIIKYNELVAQNMKDKLTLEFTKKDLNYKKKSV